MGYEPFLIAPYSSGLSTETKPWLLPADAFQRLLNAYIHHGVTYKRAGIQEFGELVHFYDDILGITATNPLVVALNALAAPASGTRIQINSAAGGSFSSINGIEYTVANPIAGFFNLRQADGTLVNSVGFGVYTPLSGDASIFPELPVMGLRTFVNDGNERLLLGMNTRRACLFDAVSESFTPLDLADIFPSGDNTKFFASATYGRTDAFPNPTIFFTNNIDNIRYYQTGITTAALVPDVNPTGAAVTVSTCRFLFSIKLRLLLLDTVENGTRYGQRMRWCRAGNPAATGSNWDQVIPGNGGFVDAPTSENIISAKQLQDSIIVQFTNSVWMVRATSDPSLPFRWDKINDFRASDSPYGTIGHDRYVISLGKRGIVACDGVEVKRIDDKIQNFIVNEVNTSYFSQVYSERNYANRRSWTLYPSADNEATTSDKALIRTEEEGAWSIYDVVTKFSDGTDVNMSCLGFGEVSKDYAWEDFDGTQDGGPDNSWEQFASETWSSFFIEANAEVFLGGDQRGRVLYLEKDGDDLGEPIACEIVSAGWNPYKEKGMTCQMGYVDLYLDADINTEFLVEFFADDIVNPYASQTINCLPNLGYIADIQNISLTSPCAVTAYSHGLSSGNEVFIYGVNGTIELSGGPYIVTRVDDNNITLDGVDATAFTAYTSGGQIVEREFDNVRCWKRAYAGGKGYQHYIRITNSGIDDQLAIHAYQPWFQPASKRMIG